MAKVKVRTLRPLNGEPAGKIRSYDEPDAKRLAASGAVKILGKQKAQGASRQTKAEGRSQNTK